MSTIQGVKAKLCSRDAYSFLLPPLSELKCSEFIFVCTLAHPSKSLLTVLYSTGQNIYKKKLAANFTFFIVIAD